jgi:hypothetical protein
MDICSTHLLFSCVLELINENISRITKIIKKKILFIEKKKGKNKTKNKLINKKEALSPDRKIKK